MIETNSHYTLLDHTADLGVRIWGADLKTLFKNGGKTLIHLMLRGESPQKELPKKILISGDDLADLMVRWLGELLYLLEGEKLVITSIRIVDVRPTCLEAALKTVPFDPEFHEILTEIKAVTYHQIEVMQKGDRWETQVIFDL